MFWSSGFLGRCRYGVLSLLGEVLTPAGIYLIKNNFNRQPLVFYRLKLSCVCRVCGMNTVFGVLSSTSLVAGRMVG